MGWSLVIVQIVNQISFKVFHRIKFMQIEQFAFEQTKEVFYYGIVQTVTFPAHTLPDAFLPEYLPVLLSLIHISEPTRLA